MFESARVAPHQSGERIERSAISNSFWMHRADLVTNPQPKWIAQIPQPQSNGATPMGTNRITNGVERAIIEKMLDRNREAASPKPTPVDGSSLPCSLAPLRGALRSLR